MPENRDHSPPATWSWVGEPSGLVRLSMNCDSVMVVPKFCGRAAGGAEEW